MSEFLVAAQTDIGIQRRVNQDALLIEEAETESGSVLFAGVADGMGGLSHGEMASAFVTEAMVTWFENNLAAAIARDGKMISFERFQEEMQFLIRKTAEKIARESKSSSGTTLTAILMNGGTYYIVNVGDTRAYLLRGEARQLTTDHTFVQRELERGRITAEEIETHPKRNVLLQCIGASGHVRPEFLQGTYEPGDVFLLCSDGFRHKIGPRDFFEALSQASGEEAMGEALTILIETVKEREETDNISALCIRAGEAG